MYDFKVLSSNEFELLTRDLLQKHYSVLFESFKSGRDGGIDLRHCKTKNESIIVQCKHYAGSKFSNLNVELKKEVPKVKTLAPKQYVIATSLPLTPKQKDKIVALFKPYCHGPQDVFGCDEINNLLKQNESIERAHFKLWLTSTTVLTRIINSAIYEHSKLLVDEIKEKICLYVQSDSFEEARSILKENNYCIISGVPGIGKTFLADMLLFYYISRGYTPYVVTSNISEALSVRNSSEFQVFYYDDFLGRTSLDTKFNKNEDTTLLRFISHVKNNKGIKIILTTRENILRSAKQICEPLDSSDFDHAKCVIEIGKYTRLNKAQILFNHLYFSNIPESFCTELCDKKILLKIIDHKNYAPRIIEWMCQVERHRDVTPKQYVERFISTLSTPTKLWKHAY